MAEGAASTSFAAPDPEADSLSGSSDDVDPFAPYAGNKDAQPKRKKKTKRLGERCRAAVTHRDTLKVANLTNAPIKVRVELERRVGTSTRIGIGFSLATGPAVTSERECQEEPWEAEFVLAPGTHNLDVPQTSHSILHLTVHTHDNSRCLLERTAWAVKDECHVYDNAYAAGPVRYEAKTAFTHG